jgi:GNAT superfamily N-acetyltransferase
LAQTEIIIADEHLLPETLELYNAIFRPRRDEEYFRRRFVGKHNPLTLLARIHGQPAGFWMGFELKPLVFYHWLGAVLPDYRRQGVALQLHEAQQSWARENGYEYLRCECLNGQREFIHFAVATGHAIVGVRWDATHADHLVLFEKGLSE